MHTSLKPLSFGEILDAAFTLYRRNFLRFLATSLVLGIGTVVVVLAASAGAAVVIVTFGGIAGLLAALLIAIAVAGAVMALWGALTWHAGRAYAGHKVSVGDALDASVDAASSLVGVGLTSIVLLFAAVLPGVAVGVPLVAMGQPVPGALLMLGWGIAATVLVASVLFAVLPAVMLEERGPVQAVVRSFQLASGSVGRIAGVMLVALLITSLPGLGVEAMTGGFQDLLNPAAAAARGREDMVKDLLGAILSMLTAPFLASVCVVLYFDRRIRAEALDVQLVAERLVIAGD
jgi:hypothetical protein